MNYINYITHSIFTPDVHHRSFTNDLPEEESLAKRTALAALPFIALYRPVGSVLSLGMGSLRICTHLRAALFQESEQKLILTMKEIGLTALAVVALASSLLNLPLGTLVTTSIDTAQELISVCQHLREGKYTQASEQTLSALASSLYVAFMVSGHLEWMIAFGLAQALLCLVQARGEFTQGRYVEASAKMALFCVRLNQTSNSYQTLQKRNFLLQFAKVKALMERASRGRAARHLIEHPLQDLQGQTEQKQVILVDAEGSQHSFGSHFHGFGQQLVKGDNLTLRTKMVDGKEILELDFKVNHVFREKIQKTIDDLKNINPKESQEILQLAQSRVQQIRMETEALFPPSPFSFGPPMNAQTVHLLGLGSIQIGATSLCPNLYDRVVVQLPSTATIYDLHEMISFLDLEDALKLSTSDDLDRIKLGHLYRIFFPRDATPFERTEEFFTLPLEALKQKMFLASPGMQEIYQEYFHRMKPYEILPGKIRYQVSGLSEKAYALGARAFTAAVTGAYTDPELFERVVSILKMGMLSTEIRYENGFQKESLGLTSDWSSGGADSIYTQMFTQRNINEQMPVDALSYNSKVRLLIKLEALETGSYQYYDDAFGNRATGENSWKWWGEDSYSNRPSILEFTQGMQTRNSPSLGGHEVMFKERLAPSLLQGLIVEDEQTYAAFLAHLRYRNMIQKDLEGRETILNVPIEQFIRIGTQVTEKLVGG